MNAPRPALAVLRFAKVRTMRALAGASAHNTRTATGGLEHADGHRPMMGGGVRLLAGQADAVSAWNARCESLGIQPNKLRRDAVRAVEMVLSASPAWFAQASPDDRKEWVRRSLAWASETIGGRENILQATLHDDEETPHLHVLGLPAVKKARRARGRRKRGAAEVTQTTTWGLSASDLLGGPQQLAQHQTTYAAALSGLAIERGRPRRTTGARHQSAHSYRASQAAMLDIAAKEARAAVRARAEAEQRLLNIKRREHDVAAREAHVALEAATALRIAKRVRTLMDEQVERDAAALRAARERRLTRKPSSPSLGG